MTHQTDWLSHFVSGIRITGKLEVRCSYGAPWVVVYDRSKPTEIPYHIVLHGRAILENTDDRTKVDLHAGSMVLLPYGSPHRLHDGSGKKPKAVSETQTGTYVVSENTGSGEHLDMLCGRFQIAAPHDRLIRHYLPSTLVVHATDPTTSLEHPPTPSRQLATMVEIMRVESMNGLAGGNAILDALSSALFTLALRAASDTSAPPTGLLALVSEPRLTPAVSAMMQDPAYPWTLPELASLCNMSRATFIRLFHAKNGRSATDMLTDLRMASAVVELRKPSASIDAVANDVGYQSPAAFRRAFTSWMGMPPGEWRQSIRNAEPTTP